MKKHTNQLTKDASGLEPIEVEKILELGNAPIFLVSQKLELIYFNKGASIFLEEKNIGQSITSCIEWNEPIDLVLEMFNQLLQGKEPNINFSFSCKEYRQLRAVVEQLTVSEGNCLFYCKCYPIDAPYSWLSIKSGATTDTYRKALNEAILLRIDTPEGIILEVNNFYCQTTGFTKEELVGRNIDIINYEYHEVDLKETITKEINSGRTWRGRLKSRNRNNETLWLNTTMVPFFNLKGELFQVVCVQVDVTEMVKTKTRLREQEAFLQTITDNVPILISYWDKNLNCQFGNKSYCDFFEVSKEDVLKWHLPHVYKSLNIDISMDRVDLALAGIPVRFESNLGLKENQSRSFAMQYIPNIQDGVVEGFTAIGIDIDEIKTARSEIGRILTNMVDGFFSVDKDFRYTYANPQLDRMAGCDMQVHMGKNLWDVFPEAKIFNFHEASIASMKDGQYRSVEDYNPWLDLWQETRIYPSDKGMSVFVHDIGARKKEEQHLRILNSIISQVDSGVLCVRYVEENINTGTVLFINHAFEDLLNIKEHDTPGIAFSTILNHPCFSLLNEAIDQLKTKKHYSYDFLFTSRNGTPHWTEISYTLIKSDRKPFDTYLLINLQEITDRKVAEQIEELKVRATEVFGKKGSMNNALNELLTVFADYIDYKTIELWLVEHDQQFISIAARNTRYPHLSAGIESDSSLINLRKGEGIAGYTWDMGSIITKDINKLPNGRKCSIISYPLIQNGQTIGVINISADIDDIRVPLSLEIVKQSVGAIASELERKKIEIRYEHLFNSGPDPLILCSPEGELYNYNPPIQALLPAEHTSGLFASILDVIHLEDVEKALGKIHLAYRTNSVQRFETRLRKYGEHQRWIDWTVSPFMQERLIFCIGKETTNLRLMQQELEQHLATVQQKNDFLSQLSWAQSHLVRAPLANILALAELLKDKDLKTGDSNEILDYLIESAKALDTEVKNATQLITDAEK